MNYAYQKLKFVKPISVFKVIDSKVPKNLSKIFEPNKRGVNSSQWTKNGKIVQSLIAG